jgi:hypothetical protein
VVSTKRSKKQAQYSLFQQLLELKVQANFCGLYDAADFLDMHIDKMASNGKMSKPKHGYK